MQLFRRAERRRRETVIITSIGNQGYDAWIGADVYRWPNKKRAKFHGPPFPIGNRWESELNVTFDSELNVKFLYQSDDQRHGQGRAGQYKPGRDKTGIGVGVGQGQEQEQEQEQTQRQGKGHRMAGQDRKLRDKTLCPSPLSDKLKSCPISIHETAEILP